MLTDQQRRERDETVKFVIAECGGGGGVDAATLASFMLAAAAAEPDSIAAYLLEPGVGILAHLRRELTPWVDPQLFDKLAWLVRHGDGVDRWWIFLAALSVDGGVAAMVARTWSGPAALAPFLINWASNRVLALCESPFDDTCADLLATSLWLGARHDLVHFDLRRLVLHGLARPEKCASSKNANRRRRQEERQQRASAAAAAAVVAVEEVEEDEEEEIIEEVLGEDFE
jgi:hypothetical protein